MLVPPDPVLTLRHSLARSDGRALRSTCSASANLRSGPLGVSQPTQATGQELLEDQEWTRGNPAWRRQTKRRNRESEEREKESQPS
mmetsp:Transcript_38089/g.59397  ORF Transcript_38089/g.59397 Transcript_38089/m.59397 type:complete len:86 (-) Transcript_38089:70-327(-)